VSSYELSGRVTHRLFRGELRRRSMTLLQVLRSKSLKCGVLILTWLIVGHTTGYMSKTWGGDPGGDKTGVGTDAQSAGGDAFIISEPDAKDPEYSKKKEAYDEFKEMADKEPLAV
jgi:hypothetical protein